MGQVIKIAVKGKEYPCRITMGAMRRFRQMTGRDINTMKETELDDILSFMYWCIVSTCNADDVAFDMDYDLFCDNLEPDSFAAFSAAQQADEGKRKKKA